MRRRAHLINSNTIDGEESSPDPVRAGLHLIYAVIPAASSWRARSRPGRSQPSSFGSTLDTGYEEAMEIAKKSGVKVLVIG